MVLRMACPTKRKGSDNWYYRRRIPKDVQGIVAGLPTRTTRNRPYLPCRPISDALYPNLPCSGQDHALATGESLNICIGISACDAR